MKNIIYDFATWLIPDDELNEIKENGKGDPFSNIAEATGKSKGIVISLIIAHMLFALSRLIFVFYIIYWIFRIVILEYGLNLSEEIVGMFIMATLTSTAILTLVNIKKGFVKSIVPVFIGVLLLTTSFRLLTEVELQLNMQIRPQEYKIDLKNNNGKQKIIVGKTQDVDIVTYIYENDDENNTELTYSLVTNLFDFDILPKPKLPHTFYHFINNTLQTAKWTLSSMTQLNEGIVNINLETEETGFEREVTQEILKSSNRLYILIPTNSTVKLYEPNPNLELSQLNAFVITKVQDKIELDKGIKKYSCSDGIYNSIERVEYLCNRYFLDQEDMLVFSEEVEIFAK